MSLERIEPLHELPHQQKNALTFIAWCIQRHRVSPLQKEIAKALNISGGSAWLYTEPLVKMHYLKKSSSGAKRCLRLDDLAYETLNEEDILKWDDWWKTQIQNKFWQSFINIKNGFN